MGTISPRRILLQIFIVYSSLLYKGDSEENVALKRPAEQSTDLKYAPGLAVDGRGNSDDCARPETQDRSDAWWVVDLGRVAEVWKVSVVPGRTRWRVDSLTGTKILVGNKEMTGDLCTQLHNIQGDNIVQICKYAMRGRYVTLMNHNRFYVCEVEVFSIAETNKNIALHKQAKQSIYRYQQPGIAVDGKMSQYNSAKAFGNDNHDAWWLVDLGVTFNIHIVSVTASSSLGEGDTLSGAKVLIGDEKASGSTCGSIGRLPDGNTTFLRCSQSLWGRYVTVKSQRTFYLAEVQVFPMTGKTNIALGREATQDSNKYDAVRAVDGNNQTKSSQDSCIINYALTVVHLWTVFLTKSSEITRICITQMDSYQQGPKIRIIFHNAVVNEDIVIRADSTKCFTYKTYRTTDKIVLDNSASTSSLRFCEVQVFGPTLSEYRIYEGTVHIFMFGKVTWSEAVKRCRQKSGTLMSLHDTDRNKLRFLNHTFKEIEFPSAWIKKGGVPELDGDTCPLFSSSEAILVTGRCSQRRSFICEAEGPEIIMTERYRYYLFKARVSWDHANSMCAARNSSLMAYNVSILIEALNRNNIDEIWTRRSDNGGASDAKRRRGCYTWITKYAMGAKSPKDCAAPFPFACIEALPDAERSVAVASTQKPMKHDDNKNNSGFSGITQLTGIVLALGALLVIIIIVFTVILAIYCRRKTKRFQPTRASLARCQYGQPLNLPNGEGMETAQHRGTEMIEPSYRTLAAALDNGDYADINPADETEATKRAVTLPVGESQSSEATKSDVDGTKTNLQSNLASLYAVVNKRVKTVGNPEQGTETKGEVALYAMPNKDKKKKQPANDAPESGSQDQAALYAMPDKTKKKTKAQETKTTGKMSVNRNAMEETRLYSMPDKHEMKHHVEELHKAPEQVNLQDRNTAMANSDQKNPTNAAKSKIPINIHDEDVGKTFKIENADEVNTYYNAVRIGTLPTECAQQNNGADTYYNIFPRNNQMVQQKEEDIDYYNCGSTDQYGREQPIARNVTLETGSADLYQEI